MFSPRMEGRDGKYSYISIAYNSRKKKLLIDQKINVFKYFSQYVFDNIGLYIQIYTQW